MSLADADRWWMIHRGDGKGMDGMAYSNPATAELVVACGVAAGQPETVVEVVRASALDEAVEYMRNCGPATDPNAWHAFMQKHDPEYASSSAGQAWLWMEERNLHGSTDE